MENEVSTMAMAESDAQNQIVSGEASPLLLPRCIRPDLFKITDCDKFVRLSFKQAFGVKEAA